MTKKTSGGVTHPVVLPAGVTDEGGGERAGGGDTATRHRHGDEVRRDDGEADLERADGVVLVARVDRADNLPAMESLLFKRFAAAGHWPRDRSGRSSGQGNPARTV